MRIPYIVIIHDNQIESIKQTSDGHKISDLLAAIAVNYPDIQWSDKEIDDICAKQRLTIEIDRPHKYRTICVTWIEVAPF